MENSFHEWIESNMDYLAKEMFTLGLFGRKDSVIVTKMLHRAFNGGVEIGKTAKEEPE